jgi:hypothetical protein
VNGAERYLKLLQEIDQQQNVTDASPIAQQGAKDLAELEKRAKEFLARKISIPVDAPEQKDIDDALGILQRQIDLRKVGIKVVIEREEAARQLSKLQADIAAGMAKGANVSVLRGQLLPLQIQIRNLDVERERINKDLAATLDRQVAQDGKRVLTAKEQLELAKGKLAVEQDRASLADRSSAIDASRLKMVQQVADAYMNLASAQAALSQSAYDVEISRNSSRLSLAEKELQFLRERGANTQTIQVAEGNIVAIKREGEQIQFRAMKADIEATAQRFQMERQSLAIKQAMQILEQQSAIRKAEMVVMEQKIQLEELKAKQADAATSAAEKASLGERIKLKGDMVKLAQTQVKEERNGLDNLGVILGLEKQAQEAQQATLANQKRSTAAGKEWGATWSDAGTSWEESLTEPLAKLDKAATGIDRLGQVFVGTIQAGNGPIEQIFATASGLPEPLRNATDAAKRLGAGFEEANAQANVLLQTVSRLASAPAARWAGGGVDPGGRYQVNELGTESFLSRSGALSLIHAPAYGSWSPPSPGMVLPAGLTSRLDALGAFGGGPAPLLAGMAPAAGSGGAASQAAALGRLQRSIDALEGTMRSYRPEVTVNLPGNAGLLHTLQGLR